MHGMDLASQPHFRRAKATDCNNVERFHGIFEVSDLH